MAEHFGGTSEKDDPAKLDGWPWRAGTRWRARSSPTATGSPGTIEARFDAGDHVAFVLSTAPGPEGGECGGTVSSATRRPSDIDAGQPAGEPD